MAAITKLPSGDYRVQIRRKGRYAGETFPRRDDAHRWARQAETRVDQGFAPARSSVAGLSIFGDIVDVHIADMRAVGKPPRRSKAATAVDRPAAEPGGRTADPGGTLGPRALRQAVAALG
jgi:hypothetical protein